MSTNSMYGITADELHKRIIVDMSRHCKHMGYQCEHILERESGHPLEQTISSVITHAVSTSLEKQSEYPKQVKCEVCGGESPTVKLEVGLHKLKWNVVYCSDKNVKDKWFCPNCK